MKSVSQIHVALWVLAAWLGFLILALWASRKICAVEGVQPASMVAPVSPHWQARFSYAQGHAGVDVINISMTIAPLPDKATCDARVDEHWQNIEADGGYDIVALCVAVGVAS